MPSDEFPFCRRKKRKQKLLLSFTAIAMLNCYCTKLNCSNERLRAQIRSRSANVAHQQPRFLQSLAASGMRDRSLYEQRLQILLRLVMLVRALELAVSIVCASCSLCVFLLHSCVTLL